MLTCNAVVTVRVCLGCLDWQKGKRGERHGTGRLASDRLLWRNSLDRTRVEKGPAQPITEQHAIHVHPCPCCVCVDRPARPAWWRLSEPVIQEPIQCKQHNAVARPSESSEADHIASYITFEDALAAAMPFGPSHKILRKVAKWAMQGAPRRLVLRMIAC